MNDLTGGATRMELILDPDDTASVQEAFAEFRKYHQATMPTAEHSNEEGGFIAEICRGWLDFLSLDR